MTTPAPPLAIPAQYRSFFTDAQAEELVAQFQLSDGDGSGAIDEREFHALLTTLQLQVTPQEASELVASIDVDGNGLVDFAELVGMVVKIKQGDAQFQKLKAFLDALDTTPVASLEREAAKFQIHVRYQLLDEKPGTKSTPPIFVMALTLQGKWVQDGGGELTLQAVGRTTREAKFKAAEQALVRMKQLKPGLAFEPGEVPPPWQAWLFDNLETGSTPQKVMKKLREKGFSPAQNGLLMQRISTRASSLRLRHKRGRATATGTHVARALVPIYDEAEGDSHGSETAVDEDSPETARSQLQPTKKTSTVKRRNGLHPLWVHWARQELARGIDGGVVLDELVALGFEPHKFPFVAQTFVRASYLQRNNRDRGSEAGSASPQPQPQPQPLTPRSSKQQPRRVSAAQSSLAPRPYCFWRCLDDGELREVELFVHGGQELNVAQLDAASKLEMTPLQLASKAGHVEIAAFLLASGAAVDQRDAFHRTPLLLAAREGHTEICRLLLAHGADLLAVDALGNTPLHCAAASGSASTADLVLETFDERLLVFLAQLPRARKTSYAQVLAQAHASVMRAKLRENERRRFHVSWCWDALMVVYDTLFGREPDADDGTTTDRAARIVPRPRAAFLQHVLARYHDRFLQSRQLELLNDSDDSDEDEDEDEDDGDAGDAGVRQRKAAERAARREWVAFDEVAFCVDLSLREGFKNAANAQGRSPLHVACDANLVCTHELVVQCLAETHGCDPELRDHGGRTPLDLVLARKGRPGSPRGDLDTERALLAARRRRVDAKDAERERRRLETKRIAWRREVETMARDFASLETLELAKQTAKAGGSAAAAVSCSGWEMYEEPLSRNRVFVNAASGFVQRQVPPAVAAHASERLAWKEKLELHAHFVEQHRELPAWEVHRVHASDVYLFFNRVTTECRWLPPAEAPPRGWKTARIFQDQAQLDDCEDAAALRLAFSREFSAPLRSDALRGRRLGDAWRECALFGVVFYWHEPSGAVAVDKPAAVLEAESWRHAQVRIRARSEEIEPLAGGWRRWYDARSALSFYFDDASGECVLDADADRAFRRRVCRPRGPRKIRDAQLTAEERTKRLEEHEWRQSLERARQRDARHRENDEQAAAAARALETHESEHGEELRRLEASVTSEHYDEAAGRPLGYVDARFQREKEVFLAAKQLDSMVSLNPAAARPRHELDRAAEISLELDAQEREHAAVEDTTGAASPLGVRERRRVARVLWKTQERVRLDLVLCRWGCAAWLPRGQSVGVHERLECARRRLVCRLGCGAVREDRAWQREIAAHEDPLLAHCDSRVVRCPRDCGVFTPHVRLAHHLGELCVRRPVGDLLCRLGCGAVYAGGAHELLALERQRVAHEQDACALRKVQCTWPACRAMIQARDRNDHRRAHLVASGVCSFLTAEVHEYTVPRGVRQLKLQAWGAGGGSGLLRRQSVGRGGGGAFVEGVCRVVPGETLFLAVGEGGAGGRHATMAQSEQREEIETHVGVARGGAPGGGKGHAGNKESACGGGGGFTSVYRRGAFGIEYLLIAAGGGGGGTCRDGGGGGELQAARFQDGDEVRVGRPGGAEAGGAAGACDEHNPVCRFVGTDGGALQGGDGAEFGGGGGGGRFGGGGGGFAPGIAGGGGGGSSFVDEAAFERKSITVAMGKAVEPGGMDRRPPRAVRSAYWDVVDGVVGAGGAGSAASVARGNHGGVRLARPGFFKDMHHHHHHHC